ncbi:MAG: serine hydrolase [Chitinophagales bacterium]|nr:serine hydrolase [Chitinophagales bacterium]
MTAPIRILGLAALWILLINGTALAQTKVAAQSRWVDSVYNALSETERIGQLFMVAAYSGGRDYNEDAITELVANHQVGGLIFMQGTPEAQAKQNNKYQQMANVPLLIGMDAEWGLGMRLTGVRDMPRQMMVGATMDTALAYRLGEAIAAQCKRLGVHINFAPVVDVNNNPKNPIINARSFGEDKEWVAKLGIAYMRGLQDNGIMACAKHFPGHGDTETDSHKDLPTINKSLAQLEALEFYPFRRMIDAGVQSMMVAHLDIPALEKEPHIPTTLSSNTINVYLKSKMGFQGLVFTDALNMQGVAKYFEPGDVDLRAFMAGNDVLLFSQDVPTAINKIQAAINEDKISRMELELRVKKILAAKYRAGLANRKDVKVENATADLNRSTDELIYQMSEASATFVRDRNQLVNKLIRKSGTVSYIGVNASGSTDLYNELKTELTGIKAKWLPKGSSTAAVNALVTAASATDICIVAVHDMGFYPSSGGRYGLDAQQMSFLKQVQARKNVILVLMGNPYLLQHFCSFRTVFTGYEDNEQSEKVMASVMLGVTVANGKLPVTPCDGMVMETAPKLLAEKPKATKDNVVDMLEPTYFIEDAGVVNRDALDKLNLFLERSVVDGVFPGCQVLAAKNGKVFYNRAFGYYDAYKSIKVDTNSIYDVASLTKVLATTLAVMELYDQGKLDLDKTLSYYLPWVKGTDKERLQIRDLLLHQAGLKSWIPFYTETLDSNGKPDKAIYSNKADANFSVPVARDLYIRKDYRDTIWKTILTVPLENKGRYVYSDLDFYFLAAVVEKLTGKTLDAYVDEHFYQPMGLKRITYNPLSKFSSSVIVPTENDMYFRMQTIRGYVHDQGASMFGGVAGHAGIFANAHDVAAIFQMLVQGGTYNGKRFFKKETVAYFTAYNSRLSRRGLGFDKPDADPYDAGPAGERCSGYTFGHQGFTGTCAWADPETGVVFVFLSNRVNPSADNKKINHQSTRTVAQDYIYEALGIPVNRNRANVKKEQMAKVH